MLFSPLTVVNVGAWMEFSRVASKLRPFFRRVERHPRILQKVLIPCQLWIWIVSDDLFSSHQESSLNRLLNLNNYGIVQFLVNYTGSGSSYSRIDDKNNLKLNISIWYGGE